MTIDEIEGCLKVTEAKVIELAAQRLALRDVVARLLSYLADSQADFESLLREFAETGDARADQHAPQTDDEIRLSEVIRREKDWIVKAARQMILPD